MNREERCAIVTMMIGDQHLNYWRAFCEKNWRQYAERQHYDLITIDTPLDLSPQAQSRSPAWQKCLILSQEFSKKYDRIVWVDADIIFNLQTAPPLAAEVPPELVGGVISGDYIHPDLKLLFLNRIRNQKFSQGDVTDHWAVDQRSFYAMYGLDPGTHDIVQTGVLVLNPRCHREILEHVYHSRYPTETRSYEQIPLSYEIMRAALLKRLSSRFNTVFFERMLVHYPYLLNRELPQYETLARHALVTEYGNSFLLHFASDPGFIQYLFVRQEG